MIHPRAGYSAIERQFSKDALGLRKERPGAGV